VIVVRHSVVEASLEGRSQIGGRLFHGAYLEFG
jgi:hypothetical protein